MAKKKTTKKATKKKTNEPTYIREIEVRFKKKRVSSDSMAGEKLVNPALVAELFRDLQNETKEKLVAISLDTKLKILTFEVVSIGSLNAVYARPGESMRTTILVNAASFIMVHNHPSGDPSPSEADQYFTYELVAVGRSAGMPLEDHIIIGEGESYYSFAEEGWIDKYRSDVAKHRALPKRLKF